MSPRQAAASLASTAPPVTSGYLANGAFTSTEKQVSGRRARTASTTSGRSPLVSTLTAGPRAATSATKSGRPGTKLGSPPVSTSPSSQRAWLVTKRRTAAGDSSGTVCGRQANPALWQWGQRKLQPPKNNTAARCPGQSHKDMGSMPRTSSQAGEDCMVVKYR